MRINARLEKDSVRTVSMNAWTMYDVREFNTGNRVALELSSLYESEPAGLSLLREIRMPRTESPSRARRCEMMGPI